MDKKTTTKILAVIVISLAVGAFAGMGYKTHQAKDGLMEFWTDTGDAVFLYADESADFNIEGGDLIIWADLVMPSWGSVIQLPRKSGDDPAGKPDGAIYYNTDNHEIRVKVSGVWIPLN